MEVATSGQEVRSRDSLDSLREQIDAAVQEKYKPKKKDKGDSCGPCVCGEHAWVKDVFPSRALVSIKGKLFMHPYRINNGKCILGDGVQVEVVYRPVKKSTPSTREKWESFVDHGEED